MSPWVCHSCGEEKPLMLFGGFSLCVDCFEEDGGVFRDKEQQKQ